jgi:hypothetical protein
MSIDFDNGLAAQNALGGLGLGANEGFGSRGDSGGPGFIRNNALNTWEITTVVSFTSAQASPPDLNNYVTAGNNLQRDNSFGEINVDTFANAFAAGFINPTLAGAHHLVLDMSRQPHGLDGVSDDLTIRVRRSGANLEIAMINVSSPGVFEGVHTVPLNDVLSLTVRGAGDDEMVVIDYAGGDPLPAGGINFDGGNGVDTLAIQGGPVATYTPNLNDDPAEGTLSLGASTIAFDNLEFVRPVAPVLDGIALSSAVIDENGTVTLTGDFVDPGSLSSHSIDVDWGDGSPHTTVDLVVGSRSFSIMHQYLDDNPTATPLDNYTIHVTLTDDDGLTDEDSTVITVENVDPVIVDFVSDATFEDKGKEGEPVNILANFTDVGTQDTHTAVVDWGDGSPLENVTVNQGAGFGTVTGSHAYAAGGIYTITVLLTDDDTGTAQSSTIAVITGIGLNNGILYIIGSAEDDRVSVNQTGPGLLKARASFIPEVFRTFNVADIDKIISYLCTGDDYLTISSQVKLPAIIHGDGGNDHLIAGGGSTVLLGGDGDDRLVGQRGRNILIGGAGIDRLTGGTDDDVLIGGTTTADQDDDQLTLAVNAWSNSDSFEDRVLAIDLLLAVNDDGNSDSLTGSSGRDLFYQGIGDHATDLKVGDAVI